MQSVESAAVDRVSRLDDFLTMAFGLWMLIGLMVDANSHSTDPGLESFWTSSHALFYSGFTATAAWVVRLCLMRRRSSGGILDWAPLGYRLSLIGVGLFALGGIGDSIWHTLLGVETGVDALLSPTHLLLFVGMLAIVSGPFRAAWNDSSGESEPGFKAFAPTLMSMTFSVTLVAFFFEYVWLPILEDVPGIPFNANTSQGTLVAALGIAGAVITTIVLMTGPIVASRRWHLPFGSVTTVFLVTNALLAFAFDESSIGLFPAVAAGLLADIALTRRAPRHVFLIAPPAVLWLGFYYLVTQTERGLQWPPEVWGGSIVFAILATLSIDQLISSGEFLASTEATLVGQIPRSPTR